MKYCFFMVLTDVLFPFSFYVKEKKEKTNYNFLNDKIILDNYNLLNDNLLNYNL